MGGEKQGRNSESSWLTSMQTDNTDIKNKQCLVCALIVILLCSWQHVLYTVDDDFEFLSCYNYVHVHACMYDGLYEGS